MRLWAACAAVALASACSRSPAAPAGPVAYASADGRFTARLPASWRVDETRGEARLAAFMGPGSGVEAETLFVSRFPSDSRWKSARDYAYAQTAAGRAGPVTATAGGGFAVTVVRTRDDAHLGRRSQRVRTVTVPAADGFFALEDVTDPAREAPDADFDAFVASFRAAPAVK